MRLYNNEEEERTTRHETSEISKAKLFREKKKKKNLPKMLTDDTRPIKRWTVYVSPLAATTEIAYLSFHTLTINKGGSAVPKIPRRVREKHACSGKMSYDRRNRLPF